MKKSYILSAAIFALVSIVSCSIETEGPPGPMGPPGLDGLNGEQAYVFEFVTDFLPPDYTSFLEFPGDFEMLESDVALVYLLWEVDDQGTEIWRPIPTSLFLPEGTLQYNFDFTRFDVAVFMDGDFPMNFLGPGYTDDWIVRVVVVPGLFGTAARSKPPVDFNVYDEVKSYYNLKDSELSYPGYSRF